MKKKYVSHIITFFAILLIISGLMLMLYATWPQLSSLIQYKTQTLLYTQLTAPTYPIKTPPTSFSSLIMHSCKSAKFTPTSPTPAQIQDKYLPLLAVNPEVIGWITIEDTPINYPLVQHSDNTYYLSYDSNNSPSVYGSIYIDHRNQSDLDNKNTLIYGHNMNNCAMFHALINFKDKDFFEKHPYIYVSNLYTQFAYEVFAVYVVDANQETIGVNYASDAAFLDYLNACQSRSLFTRPINFTATDQIITLVTCSYELDNARTIVQAKRITH